MCVCWVWGVETRGTHTFRECGLRGGVGVCLCASKRRVTSHRRSSNGACQCGESGS